MKRVLRFLLPIFVMMGLLLGGCTGIGSAQDSWAVYIYMCGSDLETSKGFATGNLDAMRSVPLPETSALDGWSTK